MFVNSPEERQSEQPKLLSICEAELEEVSGHEREQQTRRQLLIPNPEERQSDQPMLLSICEAELEEVSGHEREQQQTRRLLLIPLMFEKSTGTKTKSAHETDLILRGLGPLSHGQVCCCSRTCGTKQRRLATLTPV